MSYMKKVITQPIPYRLNGIVYTNKRLTLRQWLRQWVYPKVQTMDVPGIPVPSVLGNATRLITIIVLVSEFLYRDIHNNRWLSNRWIQSTNRGCGFKPSSIFSPGRHFISPISLKSVWFDCWITSFLWVIKSLTTSTESKNNQIHELFFNTIHY